MYHITVTRAGSTNLLETGIPTERMAIDRNAEIAQEWAEVGCTVQNHGSDEDGQNCIILYENGGMGQRFELCVREDTTFLPDDQRPVTENAYNDTL